MVYPEIKTKRLILGKVTKEDIPEIMEYAGDIEVSKTTLNMPHPYEEKDAIFWINLAYQSYEDGSGMVFGIRDKSSRSFMGGMGLKIQRRFDRAEMGYWLGRKFWNNGYATEAASAVIKYGFEELGLNKIYATHVVDNPASGKVMINNGMIKEAELKQHVKKNGEYLDLIQYRITRVEYEQRPKAKSSL